MRMKIQKSVLLFFLAGFLFPLQIVHADECDDAYNTAAATYESAKQAIDQKDYENAAALYDEAAEEFKKVSEMKGCRCPKIARISQDKMASCQDNAVKCRKQVKEQDVFEEYNRAKDKYTEGDGYARNGDWSNAVDAFEEAAEIWEGISGTETDNGRKAAKGAEQARGAAELARKHLEEEE